ncbi:MAG: hypothetical protein A3F41_04910 [Coxiella sp. RIFCSPHIGHO2_12_FULL_44_14]|nr:MAG: hypothetical protein A3F41_04910 [Coxiella sp. RIFCSPHIGHO2_12_FULL_44_14]
MKKLIASGIGLAVIAVIVYIWNSHHPKVNHAPEATLVTLGHVQEKNIPMIVHATGTLVANEKTTLSPKAPGYITHIYFHEGQFVKAGTVLVTLDDTKERQAYASAAAQAELDKATYQRYVTLRQRGVVSPQDLDQNKSKYEQSLAAEESAKVVLDQMSLVAPFDGYIGSRNISIGNLVDVGQSIVDITDTHTLKVNFSLPNRYAPLIKMNQPVRMTADFLPGKRFTAQVSYISPNVDVNTQTIEVHADFNNEQQILKPGQSVNIQQELGMQDHALVIPADALVATINGNFVYAVQDNKVISIPVEPGLRDGNEVVIQKGIANQQPIITQGQFQVKIGQSVRVDSQKPIKAG